MEHGRRVRKRFQNIARDDETFPEIGVDFEATGSVTVGTVGTGRAQLFRQRLAVDFGERWLRKLTIKASPVEDQV